jgi:mono/diheme cytochrome c family protein
VKRACLCLGLVLFSGCDWSLQRMTDQQRCDPDGTTRLLPGGSCNRAPPEGSVPFSEPPRGEPNAPRPTRLGPRELARARGDFDVVCATCHGVLGDGGSEVARHMRFRVPPSLHEPRLRATSDQHVFDVISRGYGLMPSYAHMLAPERRWGVVAYVRALQTSQSVALRDLPPALREEAARWLE